LRTVALAVVVLATLTLPLQGEARSDAVIAPPEGEFSPVWSPDGTQIAFQSRDGVQVVDVRTRRITPLMPQGPELAWSPDGHEFLITQTQPAPPPEPRPCSNQHPDMICIAHCPVPFRLPSARTPDSHHDCWRQSEIYVTGREGEAVNLTRTDRASEHSPAWSPDGSMIAFGRDNSIWTMRRDGSAPRRVTSGQVADHQPAWSPDGRTIAFARNGAIFVVDAGGGDARPLVTGPFYALHPSWSPEGMLAYSHDSGTGASITVVKSDGTGARQLVRGNNPAWSPDGGWIAFVAPVRERLYAIYVVRPNGDGLTRITGPSISPYTSDPACTAAGTPRRDRLSGTKQRDFVCALAGHDVVRTGAGVDTILGGPGRDRLMPGSGADDVYGGEGNDEVFAVDSPRERDLIRCGRGRDIVHADRRDAVGADCERVLRRA
jgi:dipeptidyl aminopeptidase/acylaminoacyl peptidase